MTNCLLHCKRGFNGEKSIFDVVTDNTIQTEIDGGDTRVKLLETNYSSDPIPECFRCMQDGVFYNDKVFAVTYKVSVKSLLCR